MVHLNVRSWYSCLGGASSPAALVAKAASYGQGYLALTDWQTTAGAVKFAVACREAGIEPIFGAGISVGGVPLTLLAADREGYGNLTDLLTLVNLDREDPHLTMDQLVECGEDGALEGILCLTGDRAGFIARAIREREFQAAKAYACRLKSLFPGRLFIEQVHHMRPAEDVVVYRMDQLAAAIGVHTVATNAVRHAAANEYPLYDALTCARLGLSVNDHHLERPVNNQAFLCPHKRFQHLSFSLASLANTDAVARDCAGVKLLAERIHPPQAEVPAGMTPDGFMESLCRDALPKRYKPGSRRHHEAESVLARELGVIRTLENSEFFLVVREVMEFARTHGIRCTGRGSAANSIVAYLLRITNADPIEHRLLFERFLHEGRQGTPDIDVDFDSSRRDVVISWMNRRYGETHTAMVANVVTLQLKLAVREMMKVLGFPPPSLTAATRVLPHFSSNGLEMYRDELAEALGMRPDAVALAVLCDLVTRLYGAPRHLSLHSGGMVLARQPLRYFSPIRTSANGVRQVEFDKDDLDELGIVKLDVLGLRMLGAVSEAVDRLDLDCGITVDVDALLEDETDDAAFELIRSGQTLGIFQIESPGQMRLLAETQPKTFADLVIQVALFRPGPLQGGMVNPYLEYLRTGRKPVFPHPTLEPILGDTGGLLVFQEQVLEIVHKFAGMTLRQADDFRRLMSKFRDREQMEGMRAGFLAGAVEHNRDTPHPVTEELANQVFNLIAPFVGYGFCRSHAVAFAHTVYQTAWLKAHHPAAHFCAVLQHRPGFYPAQTLAQEARAFGVPVLPVDARFSDIQYRLEKLPSDGEEDRYGIRLPFSEIKGLSEDAAANIVWERFEAPFTSLEDMFRRVRINLDQWDSLARAGALTAFASRRGALWDLGLLRRRFNADQAGQMTLDMALVTPGEAPELPRFTPMNRTDWDFQTHGMTAGLHPVAHYRPYLDRFNVRPLREMYYMAPGKWVRTAGVVVARQRPPTAKGFCFIELEDETGMLQMALSPKVYEEYSRVIREPGLVVEGKLEGARNHRSILGQRIRSLESVLRQPHVGGYFSHPGQMAK